MKRKDEQRKSLNRNQLGKNENHPKSSRQKREGNDQQQQQSDSKRKQQQG